ncbi:MAG: VanW family protein [Acidimicrobiia bacterium]|nr:VanW family protein [Acidimicrobiia bacterium]
MSTSTRRLTLFIAVPVMLLLLPLSIYFVDTALASDQAARNVSIEGTDVSRLPADEVAAVADDYADTQTANVITVSVNDQHFTLDPVEIGTSFDTDTAVTRALNANKDGLSGWLRAFSQAVDVPVEGSVDVVLLAEKLTEWETEAIPNPAFEGSVTIKNQKAVIEYPHSGLAIDRTIATELVSDAVMDGTTDIIVIPLVDSQPTLTNSDLDAAAVRAQAIIDRGVTLTNEEYGFTFEVTPLTMAQALSVDIVKGSPATINYSIDPAVIIPLAESQRANLEVDPADAYWDIIEVDDFEDWDENYKITDSPQEGVEGLPENDVITLVPSKMGTSLDVNLVVEAVQAAALGDGTGELVLQHTIEPEFSTEDALAYGELYEVSEFTTYKPGTNRSHNIDLMADTIDGYMVMPGELFSVNEVVGRRTLEKGYKYDCAIVSGELSCEDDAVNIGGGVSQFGTTIFNAIFFGCYEDVEHQPHSIYFSKYPEGREATLGYPKPDVVFRNNTEAPVIIKTSHTKRSITVTFFGNNGGMTCASERSERSGYTSPQVSYQTDPEVFVAPGEEKVKSKGSGGWAVTVTRVFYDAQGNEVDREPFYWRYRGEKNVILLHPCDPRVGGSGECPDPVPNVVGMSEAAARAAIGAAGYAVTVVYVDDPGAPDRVVSQSNTGGYPKPGTPVTINVDNTPIAPPPSP